MHNIISAQDSAKKSQLYEVRSNDQYVFWLETDPKKSSRQFLCCYKIATQQKTSVTSPDDFNIKSGINEYGGGSYWLNNHRLYFYNKDNGAIYYIALDTEITSAKINPILVAASLPVNTKVSQNYSDGIVLSNNGFIAVREITLGEVITQQIIIYDEQINKIVILDDEHDFYAFPRLNDVTNQLVWISWGHPNMPWDKSALYMAELTNHENAWQLIKKCVLIDIEKNSLYQPQWLDNYNIFIVSEHENKFWNLYLFNINSHRFTPVITGQFELGLPLWQLATNTFVFKVDQDYIDLFFYKMWNGQSTLSVCKIDKNLDVIDIKDIRDLPICYIQDTLYLSNGNLYFLASTVKMELAVHEYSPTKDNLRVISNNFNLNQDLGVEISIAQEIKCTNKFGLDSYGFFYEPQITDLDKSKLPPLIVICHGGPTGTTNKGYNPKIQYWTSRGFAVLDVNYSGSTTYGKQYRDRIHLNWGEIDVADCAAGAEYLVANNKVDKNNIMIRGSSAGGLIVLLALYQYDIFSAGCCYYPVSDLILLSEQIHNFEKYYNEYLIGDLKEHAEQYQARSPVNFADALTKPILLFHGIADKVIPVSHSRAFYTKIKNNNKLSGYFEFEQEGHGFRKMDSIKEALDHEYSFYLKIIAEQ